MSDLISRQDAIEAMRKIVPYVIDKDTGQWGILVNKENVITELSALPSAEPNNDVAAYNLIFDDCDTIEELSAKVRANNLHDGWIPCSERLPSVDGDAYLVTDYCTQINHRRIRIAYCYANKDGFWSNTPKGYEVLAWMPLPEPWEDGEA